MLGRKRPLRVLLRQDRWTACARFGYQLDTGYQCRESLSVARRMQLNEATRQCCPCQPEGGGRMVSEFGVQGRKEEVINSSKAVH